jgi:hypothetical protein
MPADSIRGNNRNQMVFFNPDPAKMNEPWPLKSALEFMAGNHPIQGQSNSFPSFIPTKNMYIPVNKTLALKNKWVSDTAVIESMIPLTFAEGQNYLTKDDIAIMDILANNLDTRPIYFSVTVRNEKLMGLNDYTQLEGLGLRIVPVRTQSIRGMGIYGSGRVNADKVYDNIMKKWKWGEFDKKEFFINESYSPELSAMKMIMTRGAQEFANSGNMKKAAELSKKYFAAFPHFNFPYDYSVVPFIEVLLKSEEQKEAEKHIDILANEIDQYMQFFYSLDEKKLSSFDIEMQKTQMALSSLMKLLPDLKDQGFKNKIETKLRPYSEQKNSFKQ